ncbi:MAG: hypothetical protein ACRDKE_01555 [Solirubrobacterales bacterium]
MAMATKKNLIAARVTLLLAALVLASCDPKEKDAAPATQVAEDKNSVASYLDGGELQAENDQQRQVVRVMLTDIVQLSEIKLGAQRYPDSRGLPGSRTALQVMEAHFVPRVPRALDEATFYRDAAAPAGRQAATVWLNRLDSPVDRSE